MKGKVRNMKGKVRSMKGKGTASAVPHRCTLHAALAAGGQPSSLNPLFFASTPNGKGTTSAVPHRCTLHAALAAEGRPSSLNPGKAEQYLYSAGFSTNPRFTGF
jgi:hypothetical protein